MTTLEANSTDVKGILTCEIEGGSHVGRVCAACAACSRDPQHTDGFTRIQYTHDNKVWHDAQTYSLNEQLEGLRVTLALLWDLWAISKGVTRCDRDRTPDHPEYNNGFWLGSGSGQYAPWKEFGPFNYVSNTEYSITMDCGTIDPIYDFTDAHPTSPSNFAIRGLSELELGHYDDGVFVEGNSTLSFTFSAIGYAYAIDRSDPDHILLTITTRTPLPAIEGTWLDTHVGDEEDPHDSIEVMFRMLVGEGRAKYPYLPDSLPMKCVWHEWHPADWKTTPNVMTALWAGHAMAPFYSAGHMQVIATWDNGATWLPVPAMLNATHIHNHIVAGTPPTYEGVVDLSVGGGTIPWDADDIKIGAWFEAASDSTSLPICQDYCQKAILNFSYDRGVVRPDYSRATVYCSEWNELTSDEKTHFNARGGICRNESCSRGFAPWKTVPDPLQQLGLILWARFSYREKQLIGDPNSYQLFISAFEGMAALVDCYWNATGQRFQDRDYVLSGYNGWGKKVTLPDGNGHNYVIGHSGLENLFGTSDPGPGANLVESAGINFNNLTADGTNDPQNHFKHATTGTPTGAHIHEGTILGTPCWRIRYYASDIVLPMIDPDLVGAWQRFEEGCWVMVGNWDGDRNWQDAADENTVYNMLVWVLNGTRHWKRADDLHAPTVITSVVVQESFSSGISGQVGLALAHKETTMSKEVGTTDPDEPVQVRVPGLNVLAEEKKRYRNHLCHAAIIGAGALNVGGFVNTGMVLMTPTSEDLARPDRDVALPIMIATAGGGSTGIDDADFEDAENLQNVRDTMVTAGNYPDDTTEASLHHCDTLIVKDPTGVISRIAATAAGLGGRTWVVRECASSVEGDDVWWERGVEVEEDVEITDIFKDYYTGKFWLPRFVQCLFIEDLMLPNFKPVPRTACLDSIATALERITAE